MTLDEKPVETIEGKVTGGSVNIDGASALRRTSSLTLLAYNAKVTSYYWGLSNKYKLEIGLKNNLDQNSVANQCYILLEEKFEVR